MLKIVSGGQTGVDRAALDAAMALGIAVGGWCPKGRLAYDGPIADKYPLRETPTAEYPQRTEFNVRDSDATLIVTWGKPSGGTALTITLAKQYQRPLHIINMNKPADLAAVNNWLQANAVKVLNVAGPRASFGPQVYDEAYALLLDLLRS